MSYMRFPSDKLEPPARNAPRSSATGKVPGKVPDIHLLRTWVSSYRDGISVRSGHPELPTTTAARQEPEQRASGIDIFLASRSAIVSRPPQVGGSSWLLVLALGTWHLALRAQRSALSARESVKRIESTTGAKDLQGSMSTPLLRGVSRPRKPSCGSLGRQPLLRIHAMRTDTQEHPQGIALRACHAGNIMAPRARTKTPRTSPPRLARTYYKRDCPSWVMEVLAISSSSQSSFNSPSLIIKAAKL